uniref:MGA conserved domain-containing protein n=1 Tax=Strigamia maritima TaxID=126957 RepID=T1IPD6_STRMM
MSNLRTEDLQRKLFNKKTEQLLKKVAETNQALNQTTVLTIPVRKATARKSTHTSRNEKISQISPNGPLTTPKITTNGIRKAIHKELKPEKKVKTSKIRKKQLNGVHQQTINYVNNNNNKHETKGNTVNNNKNTGKVELIKETVRGIKGSLGLFLKAKITNPTKPILDNKKKAEMQQKGKQVEGQGLSKSAIPSDLSDYEDEFYEDEFYDDDISDLSLPEMNSSPPRHENSNSVVASDSRASEDAGSEEGLKLWLDDSSKDNSVDEYKAENDEFDPCNAGTDSEEQKVAAVTIQRLPTGVIHKLSSAGRIKVQLKSAKRLRSKLGPSDGAEEEMRPEVSVIDGIEFYSFETAEDLIEYTIQDQKLNITSDNDFTDESDVCAYAQPIIPTKTNDITQIKGWRSKIFAAETTGGEAPNLSEKMNFNWMKRLKDSVSNANANANAESPTSSGSINSPIEVNKCAEGSSNVEIEMPENVADNEVSEEDENVVQEENVVKLPLKRYGTSKTTQADVSRFNELYIGLKKMMPITSKPFKTKFGWFQEFGCVEAGNCVRVAVGSATDESPTFTPGLPLYTYDNKDMKAILVARNKNKPLEEVSYEESGIITPNLAKFAVEAVRTEMTPDLQALKMKTVIKIDETSRSVKGGFGIRMQSPRPTLSLNGKSILKKVNDKENERNVSKLGEQESVIDILAKRGVQVSYKPVERPPRDDPSRLSESLSDITSKVMSAPPEDYVEVTEPPRLDDSDTEKADCGQIFCKLGCVCESILVRKRKRPHCGKLDCMFNCDCGFTISSKTTGMMHKILSPSIQSCDRGDNFNSAIQTDDGPVKRRRISRPPARLMDSDFICKSAKDLLVLPQHLREKMHYEKRLYTKFERKVYQRPGTPTRGRKMTNGSWSPRDEVRSREVEPPRVPPIRIVNLKGHIPKVSPVHESDLSPKRRPLAKRSLSEPVGKSQHILACGTTIVSGRVSLIIPTTPNARALLTMGEIGKGKSSLRFIGLRMNHNPDVTHSTEDMHSLDKNLNPDIARDMLTSLNLQQKAPLGGGMDKLLAEHIQSKLRGQQTVDRIIGYVVANESLKKAMELAKKTEAPVSVPVSFTLADFIRSDGNSSKNLLETPQFNIYPIVDSTTHVFVGPFDKIFRELPQNRFRNEIDENRLTRENHENRLRRESDVTREVRDAVTEMLDIVCHVMEPDTYKGSANINYKVADNRISLENDKQFSRLTISGNKVTKNKVPQMRVKPNVAKVALPFVDKSVGRVKVKSGIHPRYLPADVVNLAYKRKMELNLEREFSELHRDRERSRRKSEVNQFERLASILERQCPGSWNYKYINKPKLLNTAKKFIHELEVDVCTKERVKMSLMTKRYNLFHHYRQLIKDLPERQRHEAVRELTERLQECCHARTESSKLAGNTLEPKVVAKRRNGKSKISSSSSESDSSSETHSSAKASLTESEGSNDGNSDKLLTENVEETDLIMTVEEEGGIGSEETPGLYMYAEVDEEIAEIRTQETIIDNDLKTTSTAVYKSRLCKASTIPVGQNVVLQFNDAAALTNLLSSQSTPSPVLLIANQTETNVELPKIVGCATISEAEFWADS